MANVTGGPTEPDWLNKGDNAWQLSAATFVGLQSLPGLAVLYAGEMVYKLRRVMEFNAA